MCRLLSVIALFGALWVATGPRPASANATLHVIEGRFVLVASDGTQLPDSALIGREVPFGRPQAGGTTVRINAVVPDAQAGAQPLTLYDLSFRNVSTGEWEPLCNPGPFGQALAVPVPGTWTQDGRYVPLPDRQFTFSCTSGAHLKCVRMGYTPWGQTPQGQSLAPYHQACTRMMRADYCGNGTSYTVAGRQLQVFSRFQPPPDTVHGQFEALWGPDGAVCIKRSRVPDAFPLDTILKACPGLAKTAGAACHEGQISTDDTILFGNRS